ncbi:MAG: hypothetical protein LQ346_005045 [Caloplaca aetnensis]|nr:MAG: hypothetical protein LQ346_005045 [Caloplaca aetnensis]
MSSNLAEAIEMFLRWWKPPPLVNAASAISKVVNVPTTITTAPLPGTGSTVSAFTSTIASKAPLPMLPTVHPASSIPSSPFGIVVNPRTVTVVSNNDTLNDISRIVLSLLDVVFRNVILGTYSFFSGLLNSLVASLITVVNGIHGLDIAYVVCLIAGFLLLVLVISRLTASPAPRSRRVPGAQGQQLTPGLSISRMQHQNDVFRMRYQSPPRHHRRHSAPPALIHPMAGCSNANMPTRLICNFWQKVSLLFTSASRHATQYTGLTQGTVSLLLLTAIFAVGAFACDTVWLTGLNGTDIHFFLWCGRRTGAIWCVIHCFRHRELAMPFLSYLAGCLQHGYWSCRSWVRALLVYGKDLVASACSVFFAGLQSLLARIYTATRNGLRACGHLIADTASTIGDFLAWLSLSALDRLKHVLIGFVLFTGYITKEVGVWALTAVLTAVDKFFNSICRYQAEHWDPARDQRDKALQERDLVLEKLSKAKQEKLNYRARSHKSESTLAKREKYIDSLEKAKDALLEEVKTLKTDPSRTKLWADHQAELRALEVKLADAAVENDTEIKQQREEAQQAWDAEEAKYRQKHILWLDVKDQEIAEQEARIYELKSAIKKLRGFLRKAGVTVSKDNATADFTKMRGSETWEKNIRERFTQMTEDLGRSVALVEWYQQHYPAEEASREEAEAKASKAEERAISFEKQLEAAKAEAKLAEQKANTKSLEELKAARASYAQLEKSHGDLQNRFNHKEKSYDELQTRSNQTEKSRNELQAKFDAKDKSHNELQARFNDKEKSCIDLQQQLTDKEKSHKDLQQRFTDKEKDCAVLEKEKVDMSRQKGEAESKAVKLVTENEELVKGNEKLHARVKELVPKIPGERNKLCEAKHKIAFPKGDRIVDVGTDRFMCGIAAISKSMEHRKLPGISATVDELVACYEKHRAQANFPDPKDNPMLTIKQLDALITLWAKANGKAVEVGFVMDIAGRRTFHLEAWWDDKKDRIWIFKKTGPVKDISEWSKLADSEYWQALAPEGQDGNAQKEEQDSYLKAYRATFPDGFHLLATDSQGELCGFYALIKTISAMFPNIACPTIEELSETRKSQACQDHLRAFTADGESPAEKNFTSEELAVILNFWAQPKGLVMRVGSIRKNPVPDQKPFYAKPHITGEENPNAIVVWIHHNGAENALAHWSGMQPKEKPSAPR